MQTVRILKTITIGGQGRANNGDIVEVPEGVAARLIRGEQAEPVEAHEERKARVSAPENKAFAAPPVAKAPEPVVEPEVEEKAEDEDEADESDEDEDEA